VHTSVKYLSNLGEVECKWCAHTSVKYLWVLWKLMQGRVCFLHVCKWNYVHTCTLCLCHSSSVITLLASRCTLLCFDSVRFLCFWHTYPSVLVRNSLYSYLASGVSHILSYAACCEAICFVSQPAFHLTK
jgi:hypothetical protein